MRITTVGGMIGLAALVAGWGGAAAAEGSVKLFTIVTVRDEVVVGLTPAQQQRLDSRDAAALARALKERGTVDVWRYAVSRGTAGELVNAPTALVGLLAHDTLRVEPYATPLPIASPKE